MDSTNPLKRKHRPTATTKPFAVPRPKKPRTISPNPSSPTLNTNHNHNRHNDSSLKSSRNFQPQIHENKHNVQYSYLYDYRGTLPPSHISTLRNTANNKRIEFRIPLNLLSFSNNPLIHKREVWGGGDLNQQRYTIDSDIVCVLYHSGLINLYGMKPHCSSTTDNDNADQNNTEFDVFSLLNKCLSFNINGNDEDMTNDFNFMYTRTSTHKMSKEEIEEEQKMDHTKNNKLNELLNGRDMIGIAVICEVLPAMDSYHSVNQNGYYSRSWTQRSDDNGDKLQSIRLKQIYPLTNFNDFVIDHKYLYPMLAAETCTKSKIPEISGDEKHGQQQNEQNTADDEEEWIEAENTKHEKYNALIRQCDHIGFVFNRDNRPCLQYNLAIVGNANLLLNQLDYIQEQKERMDRHGKYENYLKRNRSRNEQLSDDSDDEDYKTSVRGKKGGKRGRNESGSNMGEIRLNYNDQEKRYGHLLQFRLQKYSLMMENHERQYQLVLNCKMQTVANAKKYKLNKMEFVQGLNAGMKAKKHSSKIADDLKWHEFKWSDEGVTVRGHFYPVQKVWFVKNNGKK